MLEVLRFEARNAVRSLVHAPLVAWSEHVNRVTAIRLKISGPRVVIPGTRGYRSHPRDPAAALLRRGRPGYSLRRHASEHNCASWAGPASCCLSRCDKCMRCLMHRELQRQYETNCWGDLRLLVTGCAVTAVPTITNTIRSQQPNRRWLSVFDPCAQASSNNIFALGTNKSGMISRC